ncbi:type II secretion system major pseudopilin GspG [Pleionea litopenaei]|uniref:Type II secretion system core protein G n=1 Tax=Pleionea litopenaei TaxID=3070815 RepID=A0AA51RQM4_9GAMM|nr:type II secretion system major pseudopilin GspG [Pleionea sp. HL-JVS1]WMS85800.1 type II secretion system major pseudopilin GspG [Pleionea sp. HL-JVS1]
MQRHSGFSLMEILIALVIIGILGSLVVGNFFGEVEKSQYLKLKSDFEAYESGLMRYYNDNGFYPTTEQGLAALVEKPETNPEPNSYPRGGYLKKIQTDPWGNDYLYLSPAEYGEGDFEIVSLGNDKQEGGEGKAKDVFNWNVDEHIKELKNQEQ